MDAHDSETPFEQIIDLFHRHSVEFIVIGGQAALLLGCDYATSDSDFCYERKSDNLERLAAALAELGVTLRGAPADLSFRLDAKSLALGSNFTFNSPIEPLDLLGWVEPLGGFEQLKPNVERVPFAGTDIQVIGLDDLIRIKEHIGRPKDRELLHQLYAIRELRKRGLGP